MISYQEALQILHEVAGWKKLDIEWVPIQKSVGRRCSEPVMSPEASPPFHNSAMDGYALLSHMTEEATPTTPKSFNVRGTIAAGQSVTGLQFNSREGTCWEIMTGAPLPETYDCVVRVEDVLVERNASKEPVSITIQKPVKIWENIRFRGQDFEKGALLLNSGTRIRPDHVMSLASLGVQKVPVYRRPKVAVISTGREIKPFNSEVLEPGQIRNSSAPYLETVLEFHEAEVHSLSVSEDEITPFLTMLDACLRDEPDLIITTGAVSAGRFDFIHEALSLRNAKIHFHKVRIRPGKPILFGELPAGGPVIFALPGNPIATIVGLRFFLEPFLRRLRGQELEAPLKARLKQDVSKPEGIRSFLKAQMEVGPEGTEVVPIAGQSSFMIHSLNQANAWVLFTEEKKELPAGSLVEVLPLIPEHWEFSR